MNDYDDYDAQAGDSLTDAGWFALCLFAFFTFIGLVLMVAGYWS